MGYRETLVQVIEDSGLSLNKISKKCEEMGVTFSRQYLSQLKNGNKKIPRDEISRVIALVCNQPEDILIKQAHAERESSQPLAGKLIDNVRQATTAAVISMIGNAEKVNEIMGDMPDSELLLEASSIKGSIMTVLSEANASVEALIGKIDFADFLGIFMPYAVPDSAMAPKIPKGSKVIVSFTGNTGSYQDGDIICYHKLNDETLYIRQAKFLNKAHTEVLLIAYNEYDNEIFTLDELVICGKVTHVVTAL